MKRIEERELEAGGLKGRVLEVHGQLAEHGSPLSLGKILTVELV